MTELVYHSLDPALREIRLVRIERSTELDSGTVVLKILHSRLAARQKFNALSYTWGDATPTLSITIADDTGAHAFRVRQNLYDFLQWLRGQSNPGLRNGSG